MERMQTVDSNILNSYFIITIGPILLNKYPLLLFHYLKQTILSCTQKKRVASLQNLTTSDDFCPISIAYTTTIFHW
jgi:hypothetical protein